MITYKKTKSQTNVCIFCLILGNFVEKENIMTKKCELYDRDCIDCGECDVCDLDPNKTCDSCGKCIESNQNYKIIKITKIITENDGE